MINFDYRPKIKLIIWFFLANLIILSDVLYTIYDRENIYVTCIFYLYFILIFTIQIGIYFLILHRINFSKLLLSFFIFSNIYLIKIINYSSFVSTFNFFQRVLILFFIFLIIYFFVRKSKSFLIYIFSIISISFFITSVNLDKNYLDSDDFSEINLPVFESKPNIYLIGIDALAPFSIINDALGTDIDFNTHVKENTIKFPNSYGFGRTWRTWPSILHLGKDQIYINGPIPEFLGKSDSLLLSIFRSNGYKITTGLPNSWFGKLPIGKYIDNYITKEKVTTQACTEQHFSIFPRFYGFCSDFIKKGLTFIDKKNHKVTFKDEILNSIQSSDEPNFYAFHFIETGHTPFSFNHNNDSDVAEFKNNYLRSFDGVHKFISDVINKAKRDDPNAIILIFGDHGIWFYRNTWGAETDSCDNVANCWMNDKKLFNDRFANQILLVKTKNQCSTNSLNYIDHYNYHFSVLFGLISCLSNNILDEKIINRSIYQKGLYSDGEKQNIFSNFEYYMYE